jgi:hypothetical protein
VGAWSSRPKDLNEKVCGWEKVSLWGKKWEESFFVPPPKKKKLFLQRSVIG